MLKRGFVRARVDGQVVRLTDDLKLDRRIKHNIEIVIDRLKNDAGGRGRGWPRRSSRRWRWREGRSSSSVEAASRRARAGRRASPRIDAARGHPLLRPLRLHALRQELRAAQPAAVQLQQPARHVPRLRRPGHALHLRPGPAHPRPVAQLLRGRDPARRHAARHGPLAAAHLRGRGPDARHRPEDALAEPAAASSASCCCTAAATGTSPTNGSSAAAACGSTAASGRASSRSC